MEEYTPPQDVVDEWLRQCTCCPICSQIRPCDGVMSGGFCDDLCSCDELEDEDISL